VADWCNSAKTAGRSELHGCCSQPEIDDAGSRPSVLKQAHLLDFLKIEPCSKSITACYPGLQFRIYSEQWQAKYYPRPEGAVMLPQTAGLESTHMGSDLESPSLHLSLDSSGR